MRQTLQSWIQATAKACSPSLREDAVNGHCDAFALALLERCSQYFPQGNAELVVISRERIHSAGKKEEVVDYNLLSHVIVQVNGIHVDIDGIDADEQWEEHWIQPCDDPDGDGDEEDVFGYCAISPADLEALRISWSGRPVDPEKTKAFKCALDQGWLAMPAPKNPGRSPRC